VTYRKLLLIALCALAAQGCGGTVHIKTSKELTGLLDALQKRDDDISKARIDKENRAFRRFEVKVSSDGTGATVNMELVEAHPETAFLRLMKEAGSDYRIGDVVMAGHVTAKGENLSLLDAVRLIVEPQGVMASSDGNTIVLDYMPRPYLTGAIDASTFTITRSVDLRYMDVDSASALLDSTFPPPRPFNVGKLTERNTLYVTGTPSAVQQAVDLLTRVDRYPKIVMLEALVIEFDSDAFENLGASMSGFQKGTYSAGSLNYAAAPMLSFTRNVTATNPLAFTAIINALFQQDKARLVSRPYIATLSGKPATINLTTNQYVVVQSPSAGAAVYTTQSIKAGVVMNITPVVASGGVVRLQMSVEDSQFVPTQGNTAVEVNQDNASSFMTLLDGQTTIIGGMVVKRVSSSNSGLPWLRRIPILNLFTSSQQATEHHSEVAIYLTPHIMEAPGILPPLEKPHAMEMDPFWGNFTPSERLGHQEPDQAEPSPAKPLQ
jgi:type II secretory pathway component GspD/PulD (secretin)